MRYRKEARPLGFQLAALIVVSGFAHGATIYASGQRLIPGDPGIPAGQPGHDDRRENYVFAIDSDTGVATAISPQTSGLPAALAGTRAGELYGFSNGELRLVDPNTASQTVIGNNGLRSTAIEILPDGRAFILPFNDDFDTQQLYQVNLGDGVATVLSANAREIGDALDLVTGYPFGTASPFVISLGAVGNRLYGVDLSTDSLIAMDPDFGRAAVIGPVGAVGNVMNGAISYSGFSALTGVDETGDGQYDALFGAVNFTSENGETERLGGVARFDLSNGSWELVGSNPGVIFFGFGSSPVPEPSSIALVVLSLAGFGLKRRRSETMK